MVAAAALPSWAEAQPAIATPSLCDGVAGNLVANCGFEDGNADAWSVMTPPGSYLAVPQLPTSSHTGSYLLRFTGFTTSSVVTSIATVPGAQYTFTFYLVSLGIGAEPASSSTFAAYFGAEQVFALEGQGPTFDAGYARYSFLPTAVGATTEIRFDARNASAAYNLDDVSVTLAAGGVPAVAPEPGTVALVGAGLLAFGAFTRRARRG